MRDLTDNKKSIKPFFSNKGLNSNQRMLREKDVLIYDEKAVMILIKKYFVLFYFRFRLRYRY